MKILVICQYYYPEPFRITDICEELVNRGHEVTVVTGTPNYPMGEIYKGYENNSKIDEIINGVKVHRCKIIPRKTGAIYRFLNYYSYSIKSSQYIKSLKNDFDIVFINQLSPVMMANAGIKYAKRHNKKTVLYCLDLWPESIIMGGIKRKSLVYKFFYTKSKKIYKAVDKIIVTSKSFIEYFKQQFEIEDVEYLPQYAEEVFNLENCKKNTNEFIDIMFAGNIGTAQSVDTIIKVANKCIDMKKIRWHIVGDGVELNNIKKMSRSIPIIFHGRKPIKEMPKYYSMADVMIITMKKDSVLNLTLPGKIQSYMAAGKTIIGAINGETKKIVNEANCGFITEACNIEGLETIVRKLGKLNKDEIEQLGNNGRKYYESNFEKKIIIERLENILQIFSK